MARNAALPPTLGEKMSRNRSQEEDGSRVVLQLIFQLLSPTTHIFFLLSIRKRFISVPQLISSSHILEKLRIRPEITRRENDERGRLWFEGRGDGCKL